MATTVNGLQCVKASLLLPKSGPWIADVEISIGDTLAGAVSLVMEDITLSGAVFRSVTHAGNTRARIVGGAARWGRRVSPRGYKALPGLQLAPILTDAARECGERMGTVPPLSVGSWYARLGNLPASQVMGLIPDSLTWWIDDDGLTQVGTRATGTIREAYDVMHVDGYSGRAVIAADRLSPFRPGKTMDGPTVDSPHVIDCITWHSLPGELRGEVYWA